MTTPSHNETRDRPTPSALSLKKEVSIIFGVQLALVVGLVWLDKFLSFGGNLHILVAFVFVLLPVLILDKRDRPYRRYGISFRRPVFALVWTLIAMAVLFPLVVLATHLGFVVIGPEMWGLKTVPTWSFTWPEGYPMMAISHVIVVALPEEFFYRGYLTGRIDDIDKRRIKLLGAEVGWSLILVSALFGLGHFLVDFNPARLMVFFSALAFGWLRAKTGTLLAPILFHAASNIFMELFRAGYGLR